MNDEIKPKKQKSIVLSIFLLLVLVVLGWLFFSFLAKQYRKLNSKEIVYVISDSIDYQYHNHLFLNTYFQDVEQYNKDAMKLWVKKGIHPRKAKDTLNPWFRLLQAKEHKIRNAEILLKESKTLKSEGFSEADIRAMHEMGFQKEQYLAHKSLALVYETLKDKNVGYSSRPEDIWLSQQLINRKGFNIPVDGIFNYITDSALSSFQKSKALYESHKVDNITLKKLIE